MVGLEIPGECDADSLKVSLQTLEVVDDLRDFVVIVLCTQMDLQVLRVKADLTNSLHQLNEVVDLERGTNLGVNDSDLMGRTQIVAEEVAVGHALLIHSDGPHALSQHRDTWAFGVLYIA